jgi:hypothetical protein
MKRKVCVVTGTRADYGLLRWVMEDLRSAPSLQLQVVATGMHLAARFGLTCKDIEADGFVIDRRVEMLLDSDTSVAVSKSMGSPTRCRTWRPTSCWCLATGSRLCVPRWRPPWHVFRSPTSTAAS